MAGKGAHGLLTLIRQLTQTEARARCPIKPSSHSPCRARRCIGTHQLAGHTNSQQTDDYSELPEVSTTRVLKCFEIFDEILPNLGQFEVWEHCATRVF